MRSCPRPTGLDITRSAARSAHREQGRPCCPRESRRATAKRAACPVPLCQWHGQLICPSESLQDAGQHPDRPAPSRRSAGLTFVELVLALAITGIIAAAVTTMLFATTRATANQEVLHGTLVSMERGTQRLDAAVRGASQILAAGNGYLVLWLGEKQQDGQPQLNEICRIERDANAQTLTCYQAPANLAPGNNTTYALAATDFNAVTTALKGTANFPGTQWATQVTAWTMTFDNATPTLATLISYQMTVTVNGKAASAVGAASLRSK